MASLGAAAIALVVLVGVAVWNPSVAAEAPTAPELRPSTTLVDAEGLTRLLGRYLTPELLVDYRAWLASPEDRQALRDWLAAQAKVQVGLLPRDAQKAFWINLYNAATIELILRHYPLKSILKIGLIPGNAWKRDFVRADGRLLSLDAIEHDILRPRFGDPRIHFAINCASASCPPLQRQAYTGPGLDRELDRVTRSYLDSPAGLRQELRGGELVLTVSKILDWFREDFEDHRGGVIGFLGEYAPRETSDLMRRYMGRIDVRYGKYDWSLNAPPYEDEERARN
jgi:hypothetical protein